MLQGLKVSLGPSPKAWIPLLQSGEASPLLEILFPHASAPKKLAIFVFLVIFTFFPTSHEKSSLPYFHGYFYTCLLQFSSLMLDLTDGADLPSSLSAGVPTRILFSIGLCRGFIPRDAVVDPQNLQLLLQVRIRHPPSMI